MQFVNQQKFGFVLQAGRVHCCFCAVFCQLKRHCCCDTIHFINISGIYRRMAARVCSGSCMVESDAKVKCIICYLFYHLGCYKIDQSIANVIGGTSNIQFICDICLIKINSEKSDDYRPPTLKSTFNELMEMKKTVDDIHKMVKNTEELVIKRPNTSFPDISSLQSPLLSRRIQNSLGKPSTPVPKLRIPIEFGTNEDASGDLGRPVEPIPAKFGQANRPTFAKAIFITRLDPMVTVEKVMNYISSKGVDVGKTSIDCRKLVKLNQDLNELSFCSFKLSTNEELYSTLINPSFWPSSVGIRDFVQVNTTGKRPAATLSPSPSKSILDSSLTHNSKLLRTNVITPRSRGRPKGSAQASPSADIRNFCTTNA